MGRNHVVINSRNINTILRNMGKHYEFTSVYQTREKPGTALQTPPSLRFIHSLSDPLVPTALQRPHSGAVGPTAPHPNG